MKSMFLVLTVGTSLFASEGRLLLQKTVSGHSGYGSTCEIYTDQVVKTRSHGAFSSGRTNEITIDSRIDGVLETVKKQRATHRVNYSQAMTHFSVKAFVNGAEVLLHETGPGYEKRNDSPEAKALLSLVSYCD